MELKFRNVLSFSRTDPSFNRTAYGIEIKQISCHILFGNAFNRTAYGIEMPGNLLSKQLRNSF